MTDYAALLQAVAGRPVRADLAQALADQLPRYGIDATPLRLAYFVAETGEESGGFRYLHELGNAAYFARYDGRADLGNTQPGDGAKFSGAGLIELTGRANFAKYGARLGVDLINHPELAQRPDIAVATACLFWVDHGLNELADADDFVRVTKRINGGLNGFSVRKAYLARAKAALAGTAPLAPQPVPPEPAAPVADKIDEMNARTVAGNRGEPWYGLKSGDPLPQPAAPTAPALAPETAPQPVDANGQPIDIPSTARSLWTAYGHRAMAWGGGFVAAGAAFLHDHPAEAVLAGVLAVFIVLVVIEWTRKREVHRSDLLQRALAAPSLTAPAFNITPAEIAAVVQALADARQA